MVANVNYPLNIEHYVLLKSTRSNAVIDFLVNSTTDATNRGLKHLLKCVKRVSGLQSFQVKRGAFS